MPTPVCVLGLGLIGGSLLRAATAAGRQAWGWNRSPAAVTEARADGFDADADLAATLRRAAFSDALIVVAVPMPAVDDVLAAVAEHAPHNPLTDVVSVKKAVLDAVTARGLRARYVGGHPMAGTAESGWSASFPELFRDAVWVVGTEEDSDPQVWREVAELALACGSVVVPAESTEHDRAVARISHLPHLLAEALAIAGTRGGDLTLGLAAGSFRDGTRVAATAPGLVEAMCDANADALLEALAETVDLLIAAQEKLAAEASTTELVAAGFAARRRYDERTRTDIVGITPGQPGWIQQLREAANRGGVLRTL
ncbi:MAG TPA: prephenate dehydrogenase [Aldersonia sp.]